MIALKCPNCRASVSRFRAFGTPSHGSLRCDACQSILKVSMQRRIAASVTWLALAIPAVFWLDIVAFGPIVACSILGIVAIILLTAFEKLSIVDLSRNACETCGYELKGLTEPRCPECGTAFDPSETARIRRMLNQFPSPPRRRWGALFVVALLAIAAMAAFAQRSRRVSNQPQPSATTAPNVAPPLP